MRKTAMTERDKKLLIWLGCIVLLAGFGMGIIKPLMAAGAELDEQIMIAAADQAAMEDKIDRFHQIQSDAERSAENAAEATRSYYPLMQSQEVDREIIGLVLAQGLKAEELNITMPEQAFWIVPYYLSDDASGGDEEGRFNDPISTAESVAAVEESDMVPASEGPEGATGQTSRIYAAQVRVRVKGTQDQFWNLLEAIQNNPQAIRITGMFSGKLGTDSNEQDIMTIEMEVYMCDQQSAAE